MPNRGQVGEILARRSSFPECIIAGNVNPAVIQTGTPKEVYELSKQCIEKGKHAPRGYTLTSGFGLPPLAPPYNVYAMLKAVNNLGWYD